VVHLFDEIVTTLPEGVYLTALAQKNGVVSISGRAESKARVATYMRNLDASEWLKNPQLSVIETKDTSALRASDFALTVEQTRPGAEDEETSSKRQAAAPKRGK
jgi:type IV pilus assembly protein PilN